MNQKITYAPAQFNSKEAQERLIAHFQSLGWQMPTYDKEQDGTYKNLFWIATGDNLCAESLAGGVEYVEKATQLFYDLNIYICSGKITYAPEWIEKILSGQKTMTIRRTQYPCGVYDVVSEAEPDKVVCQIEIVRVEKVEFELFIQPHKSKSIKINTSEIKTEVKTWDDFNRITNLMVCMSGFEFEKDFIQYHRENYAPVKFAHTFQLVKGDQND